MMQGYMQMFIPHGSIDELFGMSKTSEQILTSWPVIDTRTFQLFALFPSFDECLNKDDQYLPGDYKSISHFNIDCNGIKNHIFKAISFKAHKIQVYRRENDQWALNDERKLRPEITK